MATMGDRGLMTSKDAYVQFIACKQTSLRASSHTVQRIIAKRREKYRETTLYQLNNLLNNGLIMRFEPWTRKLSPVEHLTNMAARPRSILLTDIVYKPTVNIED